MNSFKICTFVANFTHAAIVVNNFIKNEFRGVNVVYINENSQEKVLKNMSSNYYGNVNTCFEWLNERNVYDNTNTIFVVYGSESFILRANKYLKFAFKQAYIIDAYDILNIKNEIKNIVSFYDYYLNTQGLQIKYWELLLKDV